MYENVITKPIYQVLSELTQEAKVEVALPIAIKDWVRLKLQEARQENLRFARPAVGKDAGDSAVRLAEIERHEESPSE